ncbi:MAG: phenylacetate-CoA oxygenase/reductase subunit PaaK [Rhodospirillales bacterium]|nr:phenylacetate-CoA oxygenase/reductase subunit PaaK [Rhodospirillales bacterium]MDE2200162.1 phenylacetate-CoA oxygenase/reductase subunit PaaK [Rhodospirillales bacterium]MDE2576150.1 phenylacetate-CoA oxygenase/reductase subunit PaaK [Rhodospirillales bacterium]
MTQTDTLAADSTASAPRFHRLRISAIRRETAGAVSLRFAVPAELAAAYRFEPGQYLTLRATIDGEDIRRSYSICSAPDDGTLRVAVRQVDGGVFSTWINNALHVGDTLDVLTPTGRFGLGPIAGDGRLHVGFAAGSGITPIISIIQGVLAREPGSVFSLFYGSRSVDDILFREELEDLKDRYLGRLSVFHVLSREQQDIPILNGHLDAEKIGLLLRHVVPADAIDHAFICGPAAMLDTAEAALRESGVAAERIHVERFVSAYDGVPRAPVVIDTAAPPACVASIIVDGKRRDAPVAEGEAILDAALRAGIDLPFACKGGMCSTCRARIVEGAAEMALNYSLEPWELQQGFVLTCQARPTTPSVVVDFDAL